MTDIEIDEALALAIGWPERRVSSFRTDYIWVLPHNSDTWKRFTHLDWNVIGPIAERYDCFPVSNISMWWVPRCATHSLGGRGTLADNPQRAIAMAVIQGAKK